MASPLGEHGAYCAVLQRLHAPNAREYPAGAPCALTVKDFCSAPRSMEDYLRFAGWWTANRAGRQRHEEHLLAEIERHLRFEGR